MTDQPHDTEAREAAEAESHLLQVRCGWRNGRPVMGAPSSEYRLGWVAGRLSTPKPTASGGGEREAGWIVASGDGKRFRTWKDGWSAWTDNRDEATRYARRQDAEAVHSEDEDAWFVLPFATTLAQPATREDEGLDVQKSQTGCIKRILTGRGTDDIASSEQQTNSNLREALRQAVSVMENARRAVKVAGIDVAIAAARAALSDSAKAGA